MPDLLFEFAIEGTGEMADALTDLGAEAGVSLDEEIRALAEVGGILAGTLDEATAEAHETNATIPRTGTLDASIGTHEISVDRDGAAATWGASAEYASFLERKGFLQIEAIADRVEERLDERLGAL